MPLLLKVVDLTEFRIGNWEPEDCALLLDAISGDQRRAVIKMPWGALLSREPQDSPQPWIGLSEHTNALGAGDVIEVLPGAPKLRVLYRRGDRGNMLFATERCNSLCLMCSQPPRAVDDTWRIQANLHLIRLIDKDEPSLAISGGEPLLLGGGLADMISECARCLPHTDLHVLTNGRLLADRQVARTVIRSDHPQLQWNVPLYADVASIHDYVVQAECAFDETLQGLYRLADAKQAIEIRVVLTKVTIPRLLALAEFIYKNLTFVRHIALMGMEPIGFARANWDTLWIDPVDYQQELAAAVEYLDRRKMPVSVYNLPMCVVSQSIRRFARQSISDWKNVSLPVCEPCILRGDCAGFFASTQPRSISRGIRPVLATEG